MVDKKSVSKTDFVNRITDTIRTVDDEFLTDLQVQRKNELKSAREQAFRNKVPPRYRSVQFDGDPRLLEAQRSVIYGPYGTGKTWMGYSIARALYEGFAINSFHIAREREIYNTLLALKEKPAEYKRLYHDVDLLIIDEFGKNSQSDASASQIFNIIDYRYDWELRTILICNASTPEELRKIVPEAVQDRFVGSTHFLGGKSRRKPE